MINDYFFQVVNARGEIAASNSVLQTLVDAIEGDNEIIKDVAMKLAREQIVTNSALLSTDINA